MYILGYRLTDAPQNPPLGGQAASDSALFLSSPARSVSSTHAKPAIGVWFWAVLEGARITRGLGVHGLEGSLPEGRI